MKDPLRVALISGPMYDTLHDQFREEVEVIVEADHLTLNDTVAQMLSAGERIDVLSTHGKYAPSQRQWLHPLDEILDASVVSAFEPEALRLCRDRGKLLCVPRNVDVRVLWWRTDRMDSAPTTWDDLAAGESVFGMTGRGSGLFGLFFELVTGVGGRLFDDEAATALDPILAREAATTIVDLAQRCPGGPSGVTSWHYDEVDAALGSGVVDCAAAWPGATAQLRDSPVGGHLRPAPYPAGRAGRFSYSGCHGWAIPTTCRDLDGAVELVERLCSEELQSVEASVGGVPARTDVLARLTGTDDVDSERLSIIRRTIAESMITYPALPRFPELERHGAAALSAAIAGAVSVDDAVSVIGRQLEAVVERPAN